MTHLLHTPATEPRAGRGTRVPAPVRREQILNRALELARREGLAALTMKKIAGRVGFSEAAIYRHFPTKASLLLGLMDRLESTLLDPIRAIASDQSVDAAERLGAILRHHTSIVIERDSLPMLLLAEASASGEPALVARMRAIFSDYLDVLDGLLTGSGARPAGAKAPPPGLALLLLGLPAAMAIHHRLRPDEAAERAAADALVPLLVECVTKKGGGRP